MSRLRRALTALLVGAENNSPRRGRLLLEQLESRQMLAGDVDLLFTSGSVDDGVQNDDPAIVATSTTPEGEAADDLVAFAKALSDAGVTYYGAAWCPACTAQKQLFADGGQFLPFVEVTNSDRSLNSIGVAAEIETFPTWDFPDGSRATGVLSLSELSQRSGVSIPQSSSPSFVRIGDQNVAIGSPLHIPVDAYNPAGGPITITVEVADPDLLEAVVIEGNRSIRMSVAGYGDMVFELFEQRAPRPALRVIELAESGFYDETIFHRIIDNFVIQGGDPTGTGTGGSPLGNFDDQYHPDLQHNRAGVLSFAKSTDDTNNSQFFITDGPTRTLDFNHSIFGQLVEGEHVRRAINNIANLSDKGTNAADRPLIDIVLESMTVFEDDQNAVVMLKAKGNQTGTTQVTFTATNANGQTFSEVVTVSVVPDSGIGSNSPPFLEDIDPLPDFPNDAPATLQLSSIDVEGDPVEYFVSTSSNNVTATVNSTTGLVTVTPQSGFVGSAEVTVGVRPAPGVEGALPNQSDTQRLTFNFVTAQTLDAPTSVSLDPSSDTGASDSDNITRAGSKTFNVTGVQAGAEVLLFAGSVEVGREVAEGSSVAITTNNIAALGDGTYQITARQVVGGQTSAASPAITITYDSTPPVRVQNFPLFANLGVPLEVNLHHPEEGTGLVYSFTAAPQGAEIDPQTGVITWTPTEDQVGTQNLTLALTDVAGNVRSETFAVTVGGTPLAGTRLEVTDLNGNAITQIGPNQEFLLHFHAKDLRGTFDRAGVFAAFADILFDSNLVAPVSGVPIEFGPNFGSVLSSGSFSTGMIDELGAVSNSLAATNRSEDLIATVQMRAIAPGTVSFISEPADVSGNEFLLYNMDTAIPDELVTYGRVDLLVGARFTANDDNFTVVMNSGTTMLDVLANDTFASGITGTLSVTSVTTPSGGGAVTIENDQLRYQPATDFVGTETFEYVATDNTGVTQTATVTVTVTSDSATAPTAVNDTFTVVEDAPIAEFDVLANDIPAAPGNTIIVTAVGTSENGSTVEIGPGGESIRYQPAPDFFGTETITYTITDSGGGTATATVTFNVTGVNDPPPADDITRNVFRGDTDVVVATKPDFGHNVDGDEDLTVTIVGNSSAGGTFTVDGTTIRYTPPSSTFVGTDTVTYQTTDPGGLSSTGVLTINVLDSLPTSYKITLTHSGRPVNLNNVTATLTGTTSNGQSVNQTISLASDNGEINIPDLAPGDYEIEVPAIPFLLGMDQPQKLNFTAGAAGGELSGNINVGSLNPQFMRLQDFFNTSVRNNLFVIVQPGNDSMVILGEERTTTITAPQVGLSADAGQVTIRGNRTENGTTSEHQATVQTSQVETRAVNGDLRLLKLNLHGVSFSNGNGAENGTAAAASTQSDVQAEGEAFTANSQLFVAPSGGEGEAAGQPASGESLSVLDSPAPGSPGDLLWSDATDPLSLAAIHADSFNSDDDDEGLPPDAVDAFLATL